MGNKLDATRIALEKGFTGVSDPTTTLSAITKGMQDVASWKKGIDDAEIKLKTDTAKAYQDAKKLATERMTGNKTVDAAILEALKSTQDRLYDNQRMVQKGMQTPTDNLIFRQNASSSYDILSSYLQDYDANFQQAIKEAQGYIDEETKEFIKPTAGAYQAAIQRFQTTLGNPNLYEIVSSENGSLNMNLYKTKINTTTNTRELVLDDDGNPIIDPTMSGIGASALLKGKNQKSPRVYMDDNINKALAEDTAISNAYQVMQDEIGYQKVTVDDVRNNPNIARLIDTAAISGTTTVEQRLSILADNMPAGMEQIPVNPNEVEGLKAQGIDLDEKVKYSYLDPATGGIEPGTYNKYVMSTVDNMSKLFIPEETEDAKIASKRIFKSAIYAALERKITGRDLKPVGRSRSAAEISAGQLMEDATTIFGAINESYGGEQQKDISAAVSTLQKSSDYKFQKQEDIYDDNDNDELIGVSMTVADDEGNTRTEPVYTKVKNDKNQYINATADEYGKQLYQLFKTKDMPSYDKAKANYVKNNEFITKLNETANRKYIPKITAQETIEARVPINISTSLNNDNDSPVTIITPALNAIETRTQNVRDDEINNLSIAIDKGLTASQTKYGEDVDYSIIPDTKDEKITINYGGGKSEIINLTLDDLSGAALISDIKQKINNVFKDLFPERAEKTRTVVTQEDAGSTSVIRSVPQIMKEDEVDYQEAIKRFNAQ
jgi:hypothetical protein